MTDVLCTEKQLSFYDKRERDRDGMHVRAQLETVTRLGGCWGPQTLCSSLSPPNYTASKSHS